jgi:hypothetical protein
MRLLSCLTIAVLCLAPAAVIAQEGEAINYGDVIQGTIQSGEQDVYTFEGVTGDLVIVNVLSDALEMKVVLQTPVGASSSSGSKNITIDRELYDDATYTITIEANDGSSTGSYTLSLETIWTPETRTLPPGVMVGERVYEDLSPLFWWFAGGGVVDLSVDIVDGGYNHVDILDAANHVVDSYLGYGQTYRFAAPLPDDGAYMLRIFPEIGYDEITYTVTYNRVEPAAQLSYGGTHNGNLASGTVTGAVTFEGSAGDTIQLGLDVANPDGLHARLALSSPTNMLIYDRTHYQVDTPREEVTVLPEDGVYTVAVSSHWGKQDEGGDYTLSLEQLERTPQTISYGDEVTVVLDQPPEPVYQFQGHAGDLVLVDAFSESFISETYLGGPGGLYTVDDLGRGPLASTLIAGARLPQDGRYTIASGSYYDNPDSYFGYSYPLRLQLLTPEPLIAYGDTVDDTIDRQRTVDYHFFEGKAGDQASVWLQSADFEPEVYLFGPSGPIINGHRSRRMAFIPGARLPDDGIYTIVVDTASGFGTGSYTLSLDNGIAANATTLEYGDSIDNTTLEMDTIHVYQFEANMGDVFTLDYGDAVQLDLYGPRFSYTWGGRGDDQLAVDAGVYTAIVYQFISEGDAAYSLSLDGNRFSSSLDSDGDGLTDYNDRCPAVAGDVDGCTDGDGDGVPDADDQCPDVSGTANGCPDTDGDGIGDDADACPDVAGSAATMGCPDADGDGITDDADACPDAPGIAELDGCGTYGSVENVVNLRAGTGTNFEVVAQVSPGDEILVLGRNADSSWLWVRVGDVEAWLFSDLVTTDAVMDDLPVME